MSSVSSPLTGVIDEKDVIIDFGECVGQSVQDIRSAKPDLYQQLVSEKEQDNVAIRRGRDKIFRLYLNPLLARSNN